MEPRFPLFLIDRDGWINLVRSQEDSGWIEKIDVEANEYSGWDIDGRCIQIRMKGDDVNFFVLSDSAESLDELKQAILNYANRAGPKGERFHFDAFWNPLKLFVAAEQHVSKAGLKYRISSFIKKIINKRKD